MADKVSEENGGGRGYQFMPRSIGGWLVVYFVLGMIYLGAMYAIRVIV